MEEMKNIPVIRESPIGEKTNVNTYSRYFQMIGTMKKTKHGNVIESDGERLITFLRWSRKAFLER